METEETEDKSEREEGGKEPDLETEIKAGEWETLKRYKSYQKRSRQGKVIAVYQAVSNRLNQLAGLYYKFVSQEPKKAIKLLEELRKLRTIQDILLNCLIWEPKGSFDKNLVPQEVWELIE